MDDAAGLIMRTSLELLNDIEIASPCDASWLLMAGDERMRHCNLCTKYVYNLSAMTANEAAALIEEQEGSLCVRLYRRRDGTVITSDCPKSLAVRAHERIWRWGLLAATWLGISWLSFGCWLDDRYNLTNKTTRTMGKMCPQPAPAMGKPIASDDVPTDPE